MLAQIQAWYAALSPSGKVAVAAFVIVVAIGLVYQAAQLFR